jgi:hypothetical protein
MGGIHGDGPAAGLLGFAAADAMREWHEWLAWAVLILALLHVCGVAWGSWVHRENLVARWSRAARPRTTSIRRTPHPDAGTGLAVAAAAAAFAFSISRSSHRATRRRERGDEDRFKAAIKAQPWSVECSGCHLAYPPGILPMASWDRMLGRAARAFRRGPRPLARKLAVLREYARQKPPPPGAPWKLQRSATAAGSPQRVSEVASGDTRITSSPIRVSAPTSAGKT